MDDSGREPKNKQLSMFDPIEIPLTKGYVALVNPIDADLVDSLWHPAKTSQAITVYVQRIIKAEGRSTTEYMHRIILGRMLGRDLDTKEEVDHRNGNGLDNRRENLRLANRTQNNRNKRGKGNHLKGVRPAKNRWIAIICVDNREIRIGSYFTEQDAGIAYNHAALRYFGEFARFNDIPGWQDIHPVQRLRKDVIARKPGKSGHHNVYCLPESGRYRVSFDVNRKSIHVGIFDTIEEALEARDKARAEHRNDENDKRGQLPD